MEMDMTTIVEQDFELPDGKKLYVKKWDVGTPAERAGAGHVR